MELKRFRARPIWLHAYMLPLYVVPVLLAMRSLHIAIPVVVAVLSGILFLSTFWTVKSELVQCYAPSASGRHILYRGVLCELTEEADGPAEACLSFAYDRSKYLIIGTKIVRIGPKVDYTFRQYREGVTQEYYEFFPPNDVKVPSPSFLRLFKEQCVTPLFCFQMVSSLLMCFDSYVLQSIFSIVLMVVVEAALVFARVQTISQFRNLEQKSTKIVRLMKRKGLRASPLQQVPTEVVLSTELRPGDVIRIDSSTGPDAVSDAASDDQMNIPCDALLLKGSCAVNEAMLSGESVPLLKEPIPSESDDVFSFQTGKRHVIYSGTRIEKLDSPLYCTVLRTAFDTEQGALLSKMLSSEDIKYDPEALRFIFVLTFISLVSSVVTFFYSKKTGYPLFIDVVVLFTNSIPFELPMEMNIAVQNAVRNLISKKIFCLEPFRITLAGKANVCCFDKTGTLTDSKLTIKEIVFTDDNTSKILSCCHTLIPLNGELRGDPLDETCQAHLGPGAEEYKLVKNFPFSSDLKRQAVLARFGSRTIFAAKGAPEVIERFLASKPECYDKYREYAASGYRVIALAYRFINKLPVPTDRKECERLLTFAGFILLSSSLKQYAPEMIRELRESNHHVVMITGDNLLTARSVADQLGFPSCKGIEGAEIEDLLGDPSREGEFLRTSIFARADSKHKEMIIKKYKYNGFYTLMVGDGTNDVGALKSADVGVAMLDCKMAHGSVKPGDASVAAPFTVKSDTLRSIIEIIQQGRTSLVTTIQMYKILALNSITNAFFMALVDILGVKFSEYQMFSVGILSALAFQAISNGKPLNFISRQRPLTTIFSRYIILSILGQSIVHISAFMALYRLVPHPEVATKFVPSVMNAALYAVSCTQTVVIFVSNYIGRPFRENITENKLMMISIVGLLTFVLNIFLGIRADLNKALELVSLESSAAPVLLVIILDSLAGLLVERVCFSLFMLH